MNFGETFKRLWSNKPLLIVVGVVFAYVAYKAHQAGASTTTGTGPTNTTTYSVYAPHDIINQPNTGIQQPNTNPGTPQINTNFGHSSKGTNGVFGAGATIFKNTQGVWQISNIPSVGYKASANLVQYLQAKTGIQGLKESDIRPGSSGRYWYIWNGKKYLITSGTGGLVFNNGTDANAK